MIGKKWALVGHLLKDRNTVVTDKSLIKNADTDEFEDALILIPFEKIAELAERQKRGRGK